MVVCPFVFLRGCLCVSLVDPWRVGAFDCFFVFASSLARLSASLFVWVFVRVRVFVSAC